jgi:hypothetical protein
MEKANAHPGKGIFTGGRHIGHRAVHLGIDGRALEPYCGFQHAPRIR